MVAGQTKSVPNSSGISPQRRTYGWSQGGRFNTDTTIEIKFKNGEPTWSVQPTFGSHAAQRNPKLNLTATCAVGESLGVQLSGPQAVLIGGKLLDASGQAIGQSTKSTKISNQFSQSFTLPVLQDNVMLDISYSTNSRFSTTAFEFENLPLQ